MTEPDFDRIAREIIWQWDQITDTPGDYVEHLAPLIRNALTEAYHAGRKAGQDCTA